MANVFFDVLDTLLTMEGVPRAREAFLMLKEKGHDLYLSSSGGVGYVAEAADLLGVVDLVESILPRKVPLSFCPTAYMTITLITRY